MKNVNLILAVLCLGGCTTSSTPATGIDGGVDAHGFDAPSFDVPQTDAFSFPGPDAGPPPPPPFDAGGPVTVDAGGPVVVDAGGPVIVDAGSPMCAPAGTYDLFGLPGNTPVCSVVGSSCTVSRAGSAGLVVNCNGSRLECELEAECQCIGTTMVAGFGVFVDIDFAAQTASFSGAGEVCAFDIAMR